jgi:hypothetical protein
MTSLPEASLAELRIALPHNHPCYTRSTSRSYSVPLCLKRPRLCGRTRSQVETEGLAKMAARMMAGLHVSHK